MKKKNISHLKKNIPKIVDISKKDITKREATAQGIIKFSKKNFKIILNLKSSKGEIKNISILAGIMGTKKTSELIPLCHNIPIEDVNISISNNSINNSMIVKCTVKTVAKTGVEMEALTGVTIACLTIYDMCKSLDKNIMIKNIELIEKYGGKSGKFIKK